MRRPCDTTPEAPTRAILVLQLVLVLVFYVMLFFAVNFYFYIIVVFFCIENFSFYFVLRKNIFFYFL